MVGTAYYLTIWPPLTVNLQSIWKKKREKEKTKRNSSFFFARGNHLVYVRTDA
jgi:hypothetical protein